MKIGSTCLRAPADFVQIGENPTRMCDKIKVEPNEEKFQINDDITKPRCPFHVFDAVGEKKRNRRKMSEFWWFRKMCFSMGQRFSLFLLYFIFRHTRVWANSCTLSSYTQCSLLSVALSMCASINRKWAFGYMFSTARVCRAFFIGRPFNECSMKSAEHIHERKCRRKFTQVVASRSSSPLFCFSKNQTNDELPSRRCTMCRRTIVRRTLSIPRHVETMKWRLRILFKFDEIEDACLFSFKCCSEMKSSVMCLLFSLARYRV